MQVATARLLLALLGLLAVGHAQYGQDEAEESKPQVAANINVPPSVVQEDKPQVAFEVEVPGFGTTPRAVTEGEVPEVATSPEAVAVTGEPVESSGAGSPVEPEVELLQATEPIVVESPAAPEAPEIAAESSGQVPEISENEGSGVNVGESVDGGSSGLEAEESGSGLSGSGEGEVEASGANNDGTEEPQVVSEELPSEGLLNQPAAENQNTGAAPETPQEPVVALNTEGESAGYAAGASAGSESHDAPSEGTSYGEQTAGASERSETPEVPAEQPNTEGVSTGEQTAAASEPAQNPEAPAEVPSSEGASPVEQTSRASEGSETPQEPVVALNTEGDSTGYGAGASDGAETHDAPAEAASTGEQTATASEGSETPQAASEQPATETLETGAPQTAALSTGGLTFQSDASASVDASPKNTMRFGCYVYNRDSMKAESWPCPSSASTSCVTFRLLYADGNEFYSANCTALSCEDYEMHFHDRIQSGKVQSVQYNCCQRAYCNEHVDHGKRLEAPSSRLSEKAELAEDP